MSDQTISDAMTQIYFYSGSSDKLKTACRLCAKAVQQNMSVMVYTPDMATIKQMDELLWTFSPTSFIPHCRLQEDDSLIKVTPVILSDVIPIDVQFDVLLNLHRQYPPEFDQYKRLIEIAGDDEACHWGLNLKAAESGGEEVVPGGEPFDFEAVACGESIAMRR